MSEYNVEGEWNNFIIKLITPEYHSQLMPLILEDLMSCLDIVGYNAEIESEDWEMLFTELLKDEQKLNFMALDKETGEIAGFRICGVLKKGEKEDMPPFKHERSRCIVRSLAEMSEECKVDSYSTSEYYADFFGICVIPKFRKHGLCTEMYNRAALLCKSKGFSIAKVTFASPFSRKAGKKNGFKELGRKLCIDFKDQNGVPLNPNVDPKWYLDMGIFEL